MTERKKIAFIFPGQGSQYPGMGKDFFEAYPVARETFEEADEILGQKLSDIILEGPADVLKQTKNSQAGIFVMSSAVLRVIKKEFPHLEPLFCAGLSLGEYTALYASGHISFEECLKLVQFRGQYMNDACEATEGTMSVVLGLTAEDVESVVEELNIPQELTAANFNCPGQVVISGTARGIEAGVKALMEKGAKRVLPIEVHGAFHSQLMKGAEERLARHIMEANLKPGTAKLVMNVTGGVVEDLEAIRQNLIKQVTHSVRWEQGVRFMMAAGVDCFIEIGCGKTLSGFNKRIGAGELTISVEKVKDLELIAS